MGSIILRISAHCLVLYFLEMPLPTIQYKSFFIRQPAIIFNSQLL